MKEVKPKKNNEKSISSLSPQQNRVLLIISHFFVKITLNLNYYVFFTLVFRIVI